MVRALKQLISKQWRIGILRAIRHGNQVDISCTEVAYLKQSHPEHGISFKTIFVSFQEECWARLNWGRWSHGCHSNAPLRKGRKHCPRDGPDTRCFYCFWRWCNLVLAAQIPNLSCRNGFLFFAGSSHGFAGGVASCTQCFAINLALTPPLSFSPSSFFSSPWAIKWLISHFDSRVSPLRC